MIPKPALPEDAAALANTHARGFDDPWSAATIARPIVTVTSTLLTAPAP